MPGFGVPRPPAQKARLAPGFSFFADKNLMLETIGARHRGVLFSTVDDSRKPPEVFHDPALQVVIVRNTLRVIQGAAPP